MNEFITYSPPWYPKNWKAEIAPRNDIEQLARAAALMKHANQLKVSPKLLLATALREGRRDYGMTDRALHPDRVRDFYEPVNELTTRYGLSPAAQKVYKMPGGEWRKMTQPNYYTIAPKQADALMAIKYLQYKLGENGPKDTKITLPKESNLNLWTGSGSGALEAERKTQMIKKALTDAKNREMLDMFYNYYNNIASRKPWLYPVRGGAR
jgi:hypothetical protein